MNIKNLLSNEELLMIHARFAEHVAAIEEAAKSKFIIRTVEIADAGVAATRFPISQEQADSLLNTEQYLTSKSLINKLAPMVDLIKDVGITEPKMLSDEIWKNSGISHS
jgi:hypothetical protein